MANRKNNLKSLLSNGKTRVIIILVFLILLVMVIVGFMGSKGKNNKPAEAVGSASVGSTPDNITPVPGSNDSPGYNALQDKANSDAFKQAQEKGTTNVPVLTNESLANKKDIFDDLNKDNRKPIVEEPPVIDSAPAQVQQPQQYQAQPQAIQQPASSNTTQDRQAYQQAVQQQITTYINGWAAGQGFQEFNTTSQAPQPQQNAGNQAANGSTGTNIQQTSYDTNSSAKKGPAFVRAGSIIPAVMMTAINSDEPGPVLAQVVSGPLKGARLIGQMVSSDQSVAIQFTSISMPGAPQTFNISSFAVDPDTSRTGLATDVNNHYFLRYGLGLAAAFVSGYGEAVQNSGSTTTTNAFGGTTTILGDMSNKQIAQSAFGKVGQKLGTELDKETNRAPTVTVASGTSIGVLFMADF